MNVGERIGDYEIVAILGAGGMGQVYKVRNTLSDRIEAMKVLLPNLEGDPDLADRFLREIKVQAALDHPNIAKLHTAMRANNQLVMVMEYVEGTSLAYILERGPIPANQVVSYIAQVLDALSYAHARGVIHRDIKPANIMVTKEPDGTDGPVKLMDFGIARMKADRQLTQTGSTVGSLFYMSPEQINGTTPDPRSDLYSVGITMYEMVTGRRPFVGESDFSIMSAHLKTTPVAPIEIIPGVPAVVNDLILMAIEKDPAARFQSADAFRMALGSAFPQAVANVVSTKTMNTIPPPIPRTAPVNTAPPAPLLSSPHPVPPPQMMPPPMPASSMPAQAPAKSRRGLYMAIGAIAALAVVAAAVIEGPKLMHGGAADAQSVSSTPAGANSTAVPVAQPASNSEPAAASDSAASPVAQTTAPSTSEPAPVAPAPVQTARAIPQATPAPARSSVVSQAPAARPAPVTIAAAQSAPAAVAAAIAQAPVAQAAPVAPPQPPTAATASPELKEIRDRVNRVSVRASAAQAGVRSIEEGVQRQGLGLRGDIKAASFRLDLLLREARTDVQNGDVEGARTQLGYAEGTLAIIEKFLGQ